MSFFRNFIVFITVFFYIIKVNYKQRLLKIPNGSFFLFSVRGSGKTAFLKHHFPSALYIDLLNQSVYQEYLNNIESFYERVSGFSKSGLVIVDEIQRMPALLNEAHRLIESSKRNFILTGSSIRKLKRAGTNWLGGRAGRRYMHPFVPQELAEDFNLDQALQYGLIPIVLKSKNKKEGLKNYVELYLKEEISDEALVRNLPNFSRFLQVAALCHSQVINMENIARETQIKKHFIKDYFSILEDTLLGFFIPAYTSKLKFREQKKSKFYLTDPGVVRAFKKNFHPVSIEEKGSLFEGLVAQILRAYKDYFDICDNIYYWSSLQHKQTELDFILERKNKLIAIEVKAKERVSAQDQKGLKVIAELTNVKQKIIVYLGRYKKKTKEGIDIWPFDFFLEELAKQNLSL